LVYFQNIYLITPAIMEIYRKFFHRILLSKGWRQDWGRQVVIPALTRLMASATPAFNLFS